jgi:hypothetical protein
MIFLFDAQIHSVQKLPMKFFCINAGSRLKPDMAKHLTALGIPLKHIGVVNL